MTQYMTRVELHNATFPDDYDKLHILMKQQGFGKQVYGDDRKTYELPLAEYYIVSPETRSQILQRAITAAQKTGRKFAVVTCACTTIEWEGLKVVS